MDSKTPEASAICRSALVFDWLWFEPSTSIMLAEPGLLLMARSMPKYAEMTVSLLHALVESSGRYVRNVQYVASPRFVRACPASPTAPLRFHFRFTFVCASCVECTDGCSGRGWMGGGGGGHTLPSCPCMLSHIPPPPNTHAHTHTHRIDPPNLDLYRARVALAFNECQRVGVLRTLAPLGTCDTLPASDKEVLKAICPALYRPAPPQTGASPGGGAAAAGGTSGSAGETRGRGFSLACA
jgi:hypothetical protein